MEGAIGVVVFRGYFQAPLTIFVEAGDGIADGIGGLAAYVSVIRAKASSDSSPPLTAKSGSSFMDDLRTFLTRVRRTVGVALLTAKDCAGKFVMTISVAVPTSSPTNRMFSVKTVPASFSTALGVSVYLTVNFTVVALTFSTTSEGREIVAMVEFLNSANCLVELVTALF